MKEEGLTTLSADSNLKYLLVGGSLGHIRVIDLPSSMQTNQISDFKMVHYWRAHTVGLTSAIYVEAYDMILTGSKDANVRLWSMSGIEY